MITYLTNAFLAQKKSCQYPLAYGRKHGELGEVVMDIDGALYHTVASTQSLFFIFTRNWVLLHCRREPSSSTRSFAFRLEKSAVTPSCA